MRILFIALFLIPLPVVAWQTNTHLQMTRDAISLMPEELRNLFLENQKFVETGMMDPNTVLKDWDNHYYIPALSKGGALDRIDKLSGVVQTKLQTARSADVTKQLCYLAHYVGDIWTPEEMINKTTGADANFLLNATIVVKFEGYDAPIENLRDYLVQRSQWRWKLESKPEIESLLYNEAVNDIAGIWLTLWQKSGKEVAAQSPAILEHKPDTLNVNRRGSAYGYRDWMQQSWRTYTSRSEAQRIYAEVSMRNQQARLSQLTPAAPFRTLEASLKPEGNHTYFVTRLRNNTSQTIQSIALLYPGIRGALATVTALEAGDVAKLEATLPAGATKDQIQIIFSTPE